MAGEAFGEPEVLAPHLARHRGAARRADGLLLSWRDWLVDLSRARWDAPALDALVQELRARGFEARRRAMFAGEPVNRSERRAALHVALRAEPGDLEGAAAHAAREAASEREKVFAAARALRAGGLAGFADAPLDAIVHIGWGGSELGPRLVFDALRAPGGMPLRFWNAADPVARERVLAGLDPRRTLFVVASKSGGTEEVHWARDAAIAWLEAAGCPRARLARHFWFVSARPERLVPAKAADARVFRIWDWVGGRFSLWSAVSAGVVAALGEDAFAALLAGARAMDRHFLTAPPLENLPVVLGLAAAWHRLLGIPTRAVFAYDARLRLLVEHLQQLEMESLGKGVDEAGRPLPLAPGGIVWGGEGTRAEHAVFQWLHQAPEPVAVEFIGTVDGPERRLPLAHLLAQAEALAEGCDGEAHARCPGGRPVSVLLLPRLDAFALGALLALMEHRVFVQAAFFGVNPFDQWGVELGKRIAREVAAALAGEAEARDAATRALVERIRQGRRSS